MSARKGKELSGCSPAGEFIVRVTPERSILKQHQDVPSAGEAEDFIDQETEKVAWERGW